MALKYSTISILVLFLAIVIITTGVYSELAYSQYAVFTLMLGLTFLSSKYRSYFIYFGKKKILYAILLSSLFFILILGSDFSFKEALTPAISLLVFCCFYCFAIASYMSNANLTKKFVIWAVIASLLTIIYGQWLQSQGVVLNSQSVFTREQLSWLKRYGAYLNANQTGHIVIMLLYSVIALKQFRILDFHVIMSFILGAIILLTIGSRAGFIFFIFVLAVLYFKEMTRWKIVLISGAVVMGLFLFPLLNDLYTQDLLLSDLFNAESPFERFSKNLENSERYFLILEAFRYILDNPFLGNGYRHLQLSFGLSSHNELLENLTNFGLLGFIPIMILTYMLYKGHMWSAILACSPAFMFSHNFYDQPSIQAAIGITLFSSRVYQDGNIRK